MSRSTKSLDKKHQQQQHTLCKRHTTLHILLHKVKMLLKVRYFIKLRCQNYKSKTTSNNILYITSNSLNLKPQKLKILQTLEALLLVLSKAIT